MSKFNIVIGALFLSFVSLPSAAQFGRSAPRRPGVPAQRPPGAPGNIGGIRPPDVFGTRVLQPRALEDKPLDEKEQRRYDALISAMEKRAAGRPGQSPSPAQELLSTFRMAKTQLQNGQEKSAGDSFEKAWDLVARMVTEPRTMTSAIGQVRTHLRELQTLASKDPELALAFMLELAPAHEKAFEAVQQPKSKAQLAGPLASLWSQLMQMGQLPKEALDRGSLWVMQFPQMVIANRPMTPEERSEYQSQLTQVNVAFNTKLQQLAQKQVAPRLRPAPPDAPIDPMTGGMMSALDAKRGPIMRFMEADVHFKFGQFHEGLAASMLGWRELLEFYRGNPGAVTPADADVHFATLERIAGANPVQGLVLMDQIDPLYRAMAQVDRFFGLRLAELWAKSITALPLNPPMLTKAAFWLEHVSRQHKDQESRYAAVLADVKNRLQEAGEKEIERDDDHDGKEDDDREDDDRHEDDDRGERRGIGGRRGITIPRSVDHTGTTPDQRRR